jgi:hypothetical protein
MIGQTIAKRAISRLLPCDYIIVGGLLVFLLALTISSPQGALLSVVIGAIFGIPTALWWLACRLGRALDDHDARHEARRAAGHRSWLVKCARTIRRF